MAGVIKGVRKQKYKYAVTYRSFLDERESIPRLNKKSAEKLAKSMKSPDSLLFAADVKVVKLKKPFLDPALAKRCLK